MRFELPSFEPGQRAHGPPGCQRASHTMWRRVAGRVRAHPVPHPIGGAPVTGHGKERRGFASMNPEKQREIASKGGRAAHQKGTAHEWTSDEARYAGRKGGQTGVATTSS